MEAYATLHELIEKNPESRKLFERFPPDTQVALEELRQNIHTHQELEQFARGLRKQSESWKAN